MLYVEFSTHLIFMRILVVEDNPHQAMFLKKPLEKQLIAVDIAYDGEQGLFLGSTSDYDVIVMDYILPKIDGISVCKRLRDKGVRAPIIMLSGHSSVDEKVIALDAGADDFLSKPYNFTELLARIRALMRRREVHRYGEITIHDLRIDRNKKKVYRSDRVIDLSPREYRILEFLALHQGKAMSRYDILENVWGSGNSLFSNVVDVHMARLRQKINHHSDKYLIQTIRGEGYIIE